MVHVTLLPMRYLLVLVLVALAGAQQSGDKKQSDKDKNKDSEKEKPLFGQKVGLKSSKQSKESTSMAFNGVDPSGKVNDSVLAKTPTAAEVELAQKLAANRPKPAELVAFLKEGGLNAR